MTPPVAASVSVLLDATSIPPHEGGVARYLRGLIRGLASREGVALTVVVQAKDAAWVRAAHARAEVLIAPRFVRWPALRLLWEQIGLPLLVRRAAADVVHSPHYTLPLLCATPRVVTVHDATFFSHPRLHSRVKGVFFRLWSGLAARVARGVIGPSVATREEFVRHTGARPASFTVSYHGVDHARFQPPTSERMRDFADRAGAGSGGWIAFLGTLEPRKNVPSLVRAFTMLDDREDSPVRDLSLIVAGSSGWDESVESVVSGSSARDRILRLGFVDDGDLPAFLGGALCVVYPSFGEGFGLPVLEAMACGATVLTTRELALPEVGGDAVAYCGTDAEAIAEAIASLLGDRRERERLSLAARRRAALFTWEEAARVHEAAYRRARATGRQDGDERAG